MNSDYSEMTGLLQFVRYDAVDEKVPVQNQLTQAAIAERPPRGAFLGIADLDYDVNDLALRMGFLHGCVYRAGLKPKDVELVMDSAGAMAMYDFGMIHESYGEFDKSIDMYVPNPEDQPQLFHEYETGVKLVYSSSHLFTK